MDEDSLWHFEIEELKEKPLFICDKNNFWVNGISLDHASYLTVWGKTTSPFQILFENGVFITCPSHTSKDGGTVVDIEYHNESSGNIIYGYISENGIYNSHSTFSGVTDGNHFKIKVFSELKMAKIFLKGKEENEYHFISHIWLDQEPNSNAYTFSESKNKISQVNYNNIITTLDDELVNKMKAIPAPEWKQFHYTNDPIENYINMLKNEENQEIDSVIKSNRTLVIVYGDSESSEEFQERATRLVASFNTHNTIKTNLITITGDKIYNGLTFKNPPSDKKVDPVKLKEITHQFVQLVEVKDART